MLEAQDLVVAARRWAKARAVCARAVDSKRASKRDVARARKALSEASDDLARAVEAFDRAVLREGGKPRKSTNWPKFLDAVGTFASAMENAVKKKPPVAIGVIDTHGEPVPNSRPIVRRRGTS